MPSGKVSFMRTIASPKEAAKKPENKNPTQEKAVYFIWLQLHNSVCVCVRGSDVTVIFLLLSSWYSAVFSTSV